MLHQLVDTFDDEPRGVRDRAMLLAGWYGCFRRGELAALKVKWMTRTDVGYTVELRGTKTGDQVKGIPHRGGDYCPVAAIVRWLEVRRGGVPDQEGALFRVVGRWGNVRENPLQPQDIARVLKEALVAAGYDPNEYSAHSLRAGAATAAARPVHRSTN